MKDDNLYIIHIGECISRIENYTKEGKDAFFSDQKTQDAVLRNLQTLSEAAKQLSDTLKESHPDIDWRGIVAFRNVLVHDYLGINFVRVWQIIENDLPALKQKIEVILKEIK